MIVIDDRRVIGVDHGKQNSERTVVWNGAGQHEIFVRTYTWSSVDVLKPQTKAEKNKARLKELRGRAGRWA